MSRRKAVLLPARPVPRGALLDRSLVELCAKARLLDLLLHFVLFATASRRCRASASSWA